MNVFIDTSSLFKKYHTEDGSKKILQIFKKARQITVSPITYLEIINTVHRLYYDRKISTEELELLCRQINHDFPYFSIVSWDEKLNNLCIKLATTHRLKTLDIIQLASGIASAPQTFLTSDKTQYLIAKKELKNVILID